MCSCRGGPIDIVGSVLQSCPLVEPLNEDQPLSEFLSVDSTRSRLEIVLIEVTELSPEDHDHIVENLQELSYFD